MPINPENLYMQLRAIIAEMPNQHLSLIPPVTELTQRWLGRVSALVAAVGDSKEVTKLDYAIAQLSTTERPAGAAKIKVTLYRALAIAELNAPTAVQGAFIPVGNVFDALVAMGKVLQEAKQNLLIVDPYMDEKVLTDFAGQARAGVTLHLMADHKDHKPTLKPAVTRWAAQYGTERPIEARLAAPRSLHDRLIVVDGAGAWTLTQSFNALAARSPASIVRVDAETAALKVAAYEGMWQAATPL